MMLLKNKFTFFLCAIIVFSSVLVFNGIVPFYSIPAREQAIWALGFAKSFANDSFFSIYAHDFGFPHPAAIAFGLPAVIPMSWLLRVKLSPELVYDLVFLSWFILAFSGCYKLCRYYNLNRFLGLLSSGLWLVNPMVLNHSGYGMLSLGMALLPLYLYACIYSYKCFTSNIKSSFFQLVIYLLLVVVSVFMDGYTFMIFAMMSSGYVVFSFIVNPEKKYRLNFLFLSCHFLFFGFSYFLYSSFIGKSNYTPSDMDFFRGWGVDLSFLILPSMYSNWIFDVLNLSIKRTMADYYGDNSVWVTTFILPFFFFLPISLYLGIKRKVSPDWLFFVVFSLIGFYLSLGPSIKFFSIKNDIINSGSQLMSSEDALFPSGNEFVYKYLPGFNVMRATYRWLALSFLMLWMLMNLTLSYLGNKKVGLSIIITMIVIYIPVLSKTLPAYNNQYHAFLNLNKYLITPLERDLKNSKMIAYIPWGNDFFANYLTPMLGKVSYNIGGDKNLDSAWKYWPDNIYPLMNDLNESNVGYIIRMLSAGEVDAIVVPYFNMIWYPGIIRDDNGRKLSMDSSGRNYGWISNEKRSIYHPVVNILKKEPYLTVTDNILYSVVKLNNKGIDYPVTFQRNKLENYRVTGAGWYYPESDHVWSHPEAIINLPFDSKPGVRHTVKIHFSVFGATPQNPKKVIFSNPDAKKEKFQLISKGSEEELVYEFVQSTKTSRLHLSVENAISPQSLGINDNRVLGVSLKKIEVIN